MKKFLLEDRPCKRIYDTRVFFFCKNKQLATCIKPCKKSF